MRIRKMMIMKMLLVRPRKKEETRNKGKVNRILRRVGSQGRQNQRTRMSSIARNLIKERMMQCKMKMMTMKMEDRRSAG
jgi:hypothetical protein